MQKIIPHLWFDTQAEEAANLYISLFKNSRVLKKNYYGEAGAGVSGMTEGSVMSVDFELDGQKFIGLNGGPVFKLTPAISFFVNCETEEELVEIWDKLLDGGFVLMEVGEYPFSKKFGWLQDRFGVNWQLNLEIRKQKITPFLMFFGDNHGKAEEAIKFYTSLFENSMVTQLECYGEGESNPEGTVKHSVFLLDGQEFMAIDSNYPHNFTFTEAISFFVNCESQEQVDKLWEELCDGGEEVQCGWLKDKYGVSWQIVPAALGKILSDSDPQTSERVMKELFKMKKIEIEKLKEAYDEKQ